MDASRGFRLGPLEPMTWALLRYSGPEQGLDGFAEGSLASFLEVSEEHRHHAALEQDVHQTRLLRLACERKKSASRDDDEVHSSVAAALWLNGHGWRV